MLSKEGTLTQTNGLRRPPRHRGRKRSERQARVPSLPAGYTKTALWLLYYMHKRGITTAAGVWLSQILAVRPSFVASLPAGMVEFLSGDSEADEAAISRWADRALQGALPVSVRLQDETALYLVSALHLALDWIYDFDRDDTTRLLKRSTREHGSVRASPDVTTVCVRGKTAFSEYEWYRDTVVHEVHLVIGREGEPASRVLELVLAAIRGGT